MAFNREQIIQRPCMLQSYTRLRPTDSLVQVSGDQESISHEVELNFENEAG